MLEQLRPQGWAQLGGPGDLQTAGSQVLQQQTGLVSEAARIVSRLQALLNSSEQLDSSLHGRGPQMPPAPASSPPPPGVGEHLRAHVDHAHQLLGCLEHEISRIQGKL
jgi:hypothetical protein